MPSVAGYTRHELTVAWGTCPGLRASCATSCINVLTNMTLDRYQAPSMQGIYTSVHTAAYVTYAMIGVSWGYH